MCGQRSKVKGQRGPTIVSHGEMLLRPNSLKTKAVLICLFVRARWSLVQMCVTLTATLAAALH